MNLLLTLRHPKIVFDTHRVKITWSKRKNTHKKYFYQLYPPKIFSKYLLSILFLRTTISELQTDFQRSVKNDTTHDDLEQLIFTPSNKLNIFTPKTQMSYYFALRPAVYRTQGCWKSQNLLNAIRKILTLKSHKYQYTWNIYLRSPNMTLNIQLGDQIWPWTLTIEELCSL